MRYIDKIIIHSTATPEGRAVTMETVKSWHVKGRGWGDIGYHYVIELDGTIKEGRPLHKVGAHTLGENGHSIGVCYVGGLAVDKSPKDTRTPEQQTALVNLIEALIEAHPTIKSVHGHREFANKACPSFDVAHEFAFINAALAEKHKTE